MDPPSLSGWHWSIGIDNVSSTMVTGISTSNTELDRLLHHHRAVIVLHGRFKERHQ